MKVKNDLEVGGAITPASVTTAERDNLSVNAGAIIWNADNSDHEIYDGTQWLGSKTRSYATRNTDGTTNNTVNLNTNVGYNIIWGGVSDTSSDDLIRLIGIGAIGVYFQGYVKVSYSIPLFSTGVDVSLKVSVTRTRGAVVDEFLIDYATITGTLGNNRDTCDGSGLIDCESGDIFRLYAVRNGTNTSSVNSEFITNLTIEKI